MLFDLDFCFANEYAQFPFAYHETYLTGAGYPANDWPVGTGMVWIPFLCISLLVHTLLSLVGIVEISAGYDWLDQWIVTFGSTLLFGGGAIWLSYRFCRNEGIDHRHALWATALIALGSSFTYHLLVNSADSHPPSAFFLVLSFLMWHRCKTEHSPQYAILTGLATGMAGLIRPHNLLFCLTPVLDLALFDRRSPLRTKFFIILWIGVSAGLLFLPQLIVWNILYGSAFTIPRASDVLWTKPNLYNTLFSDFHGMISWSPLFGLGIIGLFMKPRWIQYGIPVLIQLYIYSCNIAWWSGGSFGNRRMVGCMPLFILGLAYLLAKVDKSWLYGISIGFALWTASLLLAEVGKTIQLDHYQPWSEIFLAIQTGTVQGVVNLFTLPDWRTHGTERLIGFAAVLIIFYGCLILYRCIAARLSHVPAYAWISAALVFIFACLAAAYRSPAALAQADVSAYQQKDRFLWVVYYEKGFYELKNNRFVDGLATMLAASIIEPRHPEPWMYIALMTDVLQWKPLPAFYFEQSFVRGKRTPFFLEAYEEYLTRQIQQSPSAELYNRRGIVRGMRRQFQWARYDFEKALTLDPELSKPKSNLEILEQHIQGRTDPFYW